MRLASWTNKGLDWGSTAEVLMRQKHITNMIGKNTSLTNVIQVMLFRRILPFQLWLFHMWEFNPEDPRTLQHLLVTTHEEVWMLLFKAQKRWPMETEDVGLNIKNSAIMVSINLPEDLSGQYLLINKKN